MSTEHENGGDDFDRDLVHRYREASAGLDERPSASTRAAILAAAARQVHAKPVVAGTAYRRPSWPLAAAAAVMLSTLAVTLAIRTHEEMPQFSAPDSTSSAAEKVAAPVVPTPAQEASSVPEEARAKQSAPAQDFARNAENRQSATRESALNSQGMRESDQAATAPSKAKQAAPTPTPSERRQAATAPSPSAAPVNEAPAAPPPAAPSLPKTQPADAVSPAAEAPFAGSALKKAQRDANAGLVAGRQDQAASAASTSDARTEAQSRVVPAPSVSQERQRAEGAATESATAWLERIIRLRREGRHSEADAELKLFRERYPQVQPPSEALSPSPAK